MTHGVEGPGERGRATRTTLVLILLVLSLLGGSIGLFYWYYAVRDVQTRYTDPEERFKYGSMSTEANALPYLVWDVMPDICADKLPGGWASVGLNYEPGHALPVGAPLRTIGIPRVGFNCATCHADVVRTSPDATPQLILGMPSYRMDFQRYVRFLLDCGADPRFTAENVIAAIRKKHELGPMDAFVYRHIVIPQVQKGFKQKAQQLSFFSSRPAFGRGRYDTFNSLKTNFGIDPLKDDAIGVADIPPIWNQAPRVHHYAQWDGINDSLAERNRSAMLAAGASPDNMPLGELTWVEGWLKQLPAPRFPFPVDSTLADRGKVVFAAQCARCHAVDGPYVGQVIPLQEIGTDPERLKATTQELVDNLNTLGKGQPWQLRRFRRTNGYAAMILDGVWARAPYLHNGAVPSLRDLLSPPGQRSKVFYSGYDVYDPVNVGFVSLGAEAERVGSKIDTAARGNGNGGHLFGTSLADEEKTALIEYLKQL